MPNSMIKIKYKSAKGPLINYVAQRGGGFAICYYAVTWGGGLVQALRNI